MYFVRSDEEIYKYARKFLNNLFRELDLSSDYLVFDQLILPYHKKKFEPLFPNFKQIVVDRDPRDVYLDAKNYNAYPITEDIESFVSFYESSRKLNLSKDDSSTLLISFEDLIYDYDKTTNKIMEFLKLDSCDHLKKFSRFDPKLSIKNTQTWNLDKNKEYRNDMNIIKDRLKSWCYDF